jgi:hypothetical protein
VNLQGPTLARSIAAHRANSAFSPIVRTRINVCWYDAVPTTP